MSWSALANQHAIVTVITLALASVISFIDRFKWWPVGIYTAIICVLILFIEYPRSSKASGRTIERPYQNIIGDINAKLGILYTNYFVRFILYTVLSVPCFLTLSTLIPAFNLVILAGLYLLSNFKKEKWSKPHAASQTTSTNRNYVEFPALPSPRFPQQSN